MVLEIQLKQEARLSRVTFGMASIIGEQREITKSRCALYSVKCSPLLAGTISV